MSVQKHRILYEVINKIKRFGQGSFPLTIDFKISEFIDFKSFKTKRIDYE